MTPDVAAQFRTAGGLLFFAINASGSPVSFPVPLAGLEQTMSGAPADLAVYMAARDERLKQIETRARKPIGSLNRQRPFTSRPVKTPPSLASVVKDKNPTSGQNPWVKLCEKSSATTKDRDGREQKQELNVCLTHHEQIHPTNGATLLSAALRQIDGQEKRHLMVMVPLGAATSPGVRASIYPKQLWEKLRKNGKLEPGDEGQIKELRLNYTLCHQSGCTAEIEATPSLIADLKSAGGVAVHAVYSVDITWPFAFTLSGFGQALEGAAFDNLKYIENRQKLRDAIAKRLQQK